MKPICRDCDSRLDSSPVYGDTDCMIYVCGRCLNVNAFSRDLVA